MHQEEGCSVPPGPRAAGRNAALAQQLYLSALLKLINSWPDCRASPRPTESAVRQFCPAWSLYINSTGVQAAGLVEGVHWPAQAVQIPSSQPLLGDVTNVTFAESFYFQLNPAENVGCHPPVS